MRVLHLNRPPKSGSFHLTYGKNSTGKDSTTAEIPNNASADKVQAALEALENVGPGKVSVAPGTLPGDKLKISFDESLLGKEKQLGLIATQIGFRDLFMLPCIAAIVAAVLLALFFHPPKISSVPEDIGH